MDTETVLGASRPVIGMVHLPPLPGTPRYDADGGRERLRERARTDAERLAAGGVDALVVENFGDAPFHPERVPRPVIADLTALTRTVREAAGLPVGVNVLRNDGPAAVAVAAAVGGAFVRVNVHVGARVADQGVLEGRAHETMRRRERRDADVAVLADTDVKHSAPLAGGEGGSPVSEAVERGLADGIVVTGEATGRPTPPASDAPEPPVGLRYRVGTSTRGGRARDALVALRERGECENGVRRAGNPPH